MSLNHGDVLDGYRFLGGNPSDPRSWESTRIARGTVDRGFVYMGGDPDDRSSWEEASSIGRRVLGDTGISLLKGAIGVPETIVGIADLATGGYAGKAAEALGFRSKEAKAALDEWLTPEQRLANRKVQEADGFWDTVDAAVSNPSTILHGAVESAPSMLPAGAVTSGALKVLAKRYGAGEALPRLYGAMAAGVGEGVTSAGQTAEQVRQETADGLLTPTQAAIAATSGGLTGVIGGIAGKVANRLGIGDVDQWVAGVQQVGPKTQKRFVRALLEGFATEGVLQELPQSAQEQIAQNVALGKPWDEGLGQASAMGALAGGLMGATTARLHGAPAAPVTPAPPAPGPAISSSPVTEAAGMAPVVVAQPTAPDRTSRQTDTEVRESAVETDGNPGLLQALPPAGSGVSSSGGDTVLSADDAARVLDQAVRAPGRDGVKPLPQAVLEDELAVLEKKAQRGGLTTQWFASTALASRLGMETLKAFNTALLTNPVAAVRALRERFDATSVSDTQNGIMSVRQDGADQGQDAQAGSSGVDSAPAKPTAVAGATFEESGPVDANRRPLPLYPLAPGPVALVGSALILTSSREVAEQHAHAGGNTQTPMPVHASVSRPYLADAALWNELRDADPQRVAELTQAVREQGHDGIAFADEDGSLQLMAFESGQIRDAITFTDRRPEPEPRYASLVRLLWQRKERALPASIWRQVVKGWMRLGPVEARDVRQAGLLGWLATLSGRVTRGQVQQRLGGGLGAAFGDRQSGGSPSIPGLEEAEVDWVLRKLARGRKAHTEGKETVRFSAVDPSSDAETDLAIRLSLALGRPVLFVRAHGHTVMNAANVELRDGRSVTVINATADESVLALAMHEALHGMDWDLRQRLIDALFGGDDPLVSDEHVALFWSKYSHYTQEKLHEEIVAMLVQQNAKKRAFWERLRIKVGDETFGRIVQAILAELQKIIAVFGQRHALRLTRDPEQVSELLSSMFAVMIRRRNQEQADRMDLDAGFESWYGTPREGGRHANANPTLGATTGGPAPVTVADATFPGNSGPVGADRVPLVFVRVGADDLDHLGQKGQDWNGLGVYLTSSSNIAGEDTLDPGDLWDSLSTMVYANVRRPFVADAEFKDKVRESPPARIELLKGVLQRKGYDGLVLEREDGSLELVVFDPSQVKSADSDDGFFDANEAGIGFSDLPEHDSPRSLGRWQGAGLGEARLAAPSNITMIDDDGRSGGSARDGSVEPRLPIPLDSGSLRRAFNYGEAYGAINDFQGESIRNMRTGMAVAMSRDALERMLPADAFGGTGRPPERLLAVANLDKLFDQAVLGWSTPDPRADSNADLLHRFFAPLRTAQGLRLVQITVRETQSQNQGTPHRAVEAVDVNDATPATQWADSLARDDGMAAAPDSAANQALRLAEAVESGRFITDSAGHGGARRRAVDLAAQLSEGQVEAIEAACLENKLSPEQTGKVKERALRDLRLSPQSAGWLAHQVDGLCAETNRKGQRQFKVRWKRFSFGFNVPPGHTNAPKRLDEQHLGNVVDAVVQNILDLHRLAQQGDKKAQTLLDQRHWFRNVTEILWRDFGAQGQLLAELLAATSARTSVARNWSYALEILQRFSNGEFNDSLSAFQAHLDNDLKTSAFDKELRVRRANGKPYGPNTIGVMRVLLDRWRNLPPGVGPKVHNFAGNLTGESIVATIDTWVGRHLRRVIHERLGLDLPRIPVEMERSITGHWSRDPAQIKGEFGFGAEVLRLAAQELSEKLGYPITPPELQSIIWVAEKSRWAEQGLGPAPGERDSYAARFNAQPMQRFTMGLAVTQDDAALSEDSASRAAAVLCDTLLEDPNVVSATGHPTNGASSSGQAEQSLDVEWVAEHGKFNATRILAEGARLARESGQDAFFISRLLRPDEASSNARPGAEVYFKPGTAMAKVEAVMAAFKARSLDGFTLAVDPRANAGSPGENVIGLRVQYIPEFDRSAMPENIQASINMRSMQLSDIVRQLNGNDAVVSAAVYSYDTEVVFKEDFDAHIDRATAVGDRPTGGPAWPERSLRARLEEATARVPGAARRAEGGGRPLSHAVRADGPGGQAQGRIERGRSGGPARSGPVDLPDAIIANALGAAGKHPDYAAGKAGDARAALRVAEALVTPELVLKVQMLKPDAIVGVMAQEASGRNKIPLMAAAILAQKTGAKFIVDIVQSNSPRRTTMNGIDRLLASPRFDGFVQENISYVIVDDTITQGGSVAALGDHIQSSGGKVAGVVALTGQQRSARLSLSQEILHAVRTKFADLEADFRRITQYGFDRLTASEGQYLATLKSLDAFRDRLVASRGEEGRSLGDEDAARSQGRLSDSTFGDRMTGDEARFPALAQLVHDERDGQLPASAWLARARGWMRRSPVEDKEVRESGLLDWLASQDGDVTREQVLIHLEGPAHTGLANRTQRSDHSGPDALAPDETTSVIERVQRASLRRGQEVVLVPSNPPGGDDANLTRLLAAVFKRPILFVRVASGKASFNAVNVSLAGGRHAIVIRVDAKDAMLALAVHEILHGMPADVRRQLHRALFGGRWPLVMAGHVEAFRARYPLYGDDKVAEEIAAFLAQQHAKTPEFWVELNRKLGDAGFGRLARRILDKLEEVMAAVRGRNAFVLARDVAKVRDALTTAYAETLRRRSSGRSEADDSHASGSHAPDFSYEAHPIGDELQHRIDTDFDGLVDEYEALPGAMDGRLLDVDLARELSPQYRADRSRASEVQDAASEFISRLYAERMSVPQDGVVVLMAGGSGAGKSSAQELLGPVLDGAETVLDGTLSAEGRAAERVQQALDAGRSVQVIYVYRDPVRAFVDGVIPRAMATGRAVPVDAVARTHAGAAATVRELQRRFGTHPQFNLLAIDNADARGSARLVPLETITTVNVEGLESRLREEATQALKAGALSEKLYRAMVAPRARQGRRGHETSETAATTGAGRRTAAADPRRDGAADESGRDAGDGRDLDRGRGGDDPQDRGVLQGWRGSLPAQDEVGGPAPRTSETADAGPDPAPAASTSHGGREPGPGGPTRSIEIDLGRPLRWREKRRLMRAIKSLLAVNAGPGWEKRIKFVPTSTGITIVIDGAADGAELKRRMLAIVRAVLPSPHWQRFESGVRMQPGETLAEEQTDAVESDGVDDVDINFDDEEEGGESPGWLSLAVRKTTHTLAEVLAKSVSQRWRAGEQFIRERFGAGGSLHFHVPRGEFGGEEITGRGGRFADAVEYRADGTFVAHEVKTYETYKKIDGKNVEQSVPLSQEIRQQVLKDAWLAANVKGYTAFWHFLGAKPSKDLKEFLDKHHIKYEPHGGDD